MMRPTVPQPQREHAPQPIPLWQTVLFFGGPGGLIYLATYYV